MRELRFRIYDHDLKTMEYVTGIFNHRPDTETSSFPQYDSCKKKHKVSVMESTYRKDKNGIEVYEGDLFDSFLGILELNTLNNVFWLGLAPFKNWDTRIIKVIGNRFQNPELLK